MFQNIFSWRNPWFLVWWYVLTVFICLIAIATFGIVATGSLGLVGLVWPAYFFFGGFQLSRELKDKGYEWATMGTGIGLVIRFRSKACFIPNRDDVASVPNYKDDFNGLVNLISQGHDLPNPNNFSDKVDSVEKWVRQNGKMNSNPLPLRIKLLGGNFSSITWILIVGLFCFALWFSFDSVRGWIFSQIALAVPASFLYIGIACRQWLSDRGFGKPEFKEGVLAGFSCNYSIWRLPNREKMDSILSDEERPGKEQNYPTELLVRIANTEYHVLRKLRKKKEKSD